MFKITTALVMNAQRNVTQQDKTINTETDD